MTTGNRHRLGELRVWLDDDLIDRRAPRGWTHVTAAEQACALLDRERVVELSLDHDLGDDASFGRGIDVVDWLAEQQEVHGRLVWPRDGIVLHTANAAGRDAMARTIERYAGKHLRVRRSVTGGGKCRFTFSTCEPLAELVQEAAAHAGVEVAPVALYLSAGTDTRPFMLLQRPYLDAGGAPDAPAASVFVYVDRCPLAELKPLDWHDRRSGVRQLDATARPGVTISAVEVRSDLPQFRRRAALVRLERRNQDLLEDLRREAWTSDLVLTVRDGCRFGGQDAGRCEARLQPRRSLLASLVGPAGIRWWVADHFAGAVDPRQFAAGSRISPPALGYDLRGRLLLGNGWGMHGATLFEAVPREAAAEPPRTHAARGAGGRKHSVVDRSDRRQERASSPP